MEIWITLRADGKPGTGTQSDPYDGSTSKRFDGIMASTPPVSLIHLGDPEQPMTFPTDIRKTWQVRSGWVVEGYGMYQSIVKLVGDASGIHGGVSCFFNNSWEALANNVVMSALGFDSNWAEISLTADTGLGGEKNIKTGAVSLSGNNNLLDQIRSTNSYGSLANSQEQFAICLISPENVLTNTNIARACRAELPQGNYGSPYALFGQSKSQIISCFAQGQNTGTSKTGWVTGGVNLANILNCIVDGCTFIDCMTVAYHDTSLINGFTLQNCTAIRAASGFMNNSPNADRNVSIKHNNFSIQNRQDGQWSLGIGNIGTGSLTGIDIEDNEIFKDPTGQGHNFLIGVSLNGGSSARVLNNIVDHSDQNSVPPNTVCFGNTDATGNPVPGLLNTIKSGLSPGIKGTCS